MRLFSRSYLIPVLAVLILLDLAISFAYHTHVQQSFATDTEESNYDALITLMGDFNSDYTGLGNETTRRLNHALSIGNSVKVETYVTVGGARPDIDTTGAEMMRDYLLDYNIPSQQVIVGKSSFDTRTNLLEIDTLRNQHAWQNIALVSSAHHLYRINAQLKGLLQEQKISLHPYPYSHTQPGIHSFTLWWAIHYEWAVRILYLLPDSISDFIVSLIRQ